MNTINYTISKHAKERYVERLIGKSDSTEIARYITLNEDKICCDIYKMIKYGEIIYTGKHDRISHKGNIVNVYLKDCWVVLVDTKTEVVVTLYKIDLGCGDEFNLLYIQRMLGQLWEANERLAEAKKDETDANIVYSTLIEDAQKQIREYRAMIKNLESMCEGYQEVIDNNVVKSSQAQMEVADVVNRLVGRKEF